MIFSWNQSCQLSSSTELLYFHEFFSLIEMRLFIVIFKLFQVFVLLFWSLQYLQPIFWNYLICISVSLCREKIVLLALKAVRRIQSGSKLEWLGWPFTCIPNFEPKAFKRHGIRQLQCYISSVPHMYNDIALEMFKREPNCTEVILHPLLRVLEVNAKTLPMVLENGYNLTKCTTLYLFFDINRCVALVPQFLSFMGELNFIWKWTIFINLCFNYADRDFYSTSLQNTDN